MNLKAKKILLLFLCMPAISVSAGSYETYDIAVKNSDGVGICYNYIKNGKELSVTCVHNDWLDSRSDYNGKIRIPDSVTYMNKTRKVTEIGSFAFYKCNISSLIIPSTIRTIGRRAFMKCNIKSINLPEGVKTIDYEAFYDCKMESINIPSTIKYIYAEAFIMCHALKKVIVKDLLAFFNIEFVDHWPAKDEEHPTTYPLTFGNLYCDENTQIRDLVIPEGVKTVSSYLFYGQTGLNSIKFPSSLLSVKNSAFESCTALIYINDGLKYIGDRAFYKCSGLSSLNLSEDIYYIGKSAFEGSSVDHIYLPKNLNEIGKKAFCDCNILEVVSAIENPFGIELDVFSKNTYYNATLYVPVGTIDKYKTTKGWNQFNYIVEKNVSEIKDVTLERKTNIPVYSIHGRKLKNPIKGINIIGGKKILIK